jgi:hypothetical protein
MSAALPCQPQEKALSEKKKVRQSHLVRTQALSSSAILTNELRTWACSDDWFGVGHTHWTRRWRVRLPVGRSPVSMCPLARISSGSVLKLLWIKKIPCCWSTRWRTSYSHMTFGSAQATSKPEFLKLWRNWPSARFSFPASTWSDNAAHPVQVLGPVGGLAAGRWIVAKNLRLSAGLTHCSGEIVPVFQGCHFRPTRPSKKAACVAF